jgi:hypothetical protein
LAGAVVVGVATVVNEVVVVVGGLVTMVIEGRAVLEDESVVPGVLVATVLVVVAMVGVDAAATVVACVGVVVTVFFFEHPEKTIRRAKNRAKYNVRFMSSHPKLFPL